MVTYPRVPGIEGVGVVLVDNGTIADQVRELMPEGHAALELVGCSVRTVLDESADGGAGPSEPGGAGE